jgi:16S rRNA (adenine1518-N6/adenine1519-N6)-dimethyltransferase
MTTDGVPLTVPLTLSDTRALLTELGRDPDKRLGQNFVVEPDTIRRIVRIAEVAPGEHVLEIGPGLGTLTAGLLEVGARVTAIETDLTLADSLEQRLGPAGVRVIRADATRFDWDSLTADQPTGLVANLPYNVATTLVLDVLKRAPQLLRLTVMVQSEVADRLVAGPGDPAVGLPSMLIALYGTALRRASISPAVFFPRPRVDSAVVRIDRHDQPRSVSSTLVPLIRGGYAQRRKMLRRALAGAFDPARTEAALTAIGQRADARAEVLSIDDWVALDSVLHG